VIAKSTGIMKILLIQANSIIFPNGKPIATQMGKYAYAPTTLTTLAAAVPQELEAEIQIIDEGVQILPKNFTADLVGISVSTPNAIRAYKIADDARRRGMTVVLGGWHISLLPEEALKHADAIVMGYAEDSWPGLLKDFISHQLKNVYQDFSCTSFQSNMTIPRRDLLLRSRYTAPDTIEATRGCSNQCKYCVNPPLYRDRHFLRPIENTVHDIDNMQSNKIVFLDSSPTENLPFIKQLYRAITPLRIKWFSNITMKVADDDEWLDLAANSGCKGVLIGFESLNQGILDKNNKRFNRVEKYCSFIKKLHDQGIAVLGSFMFGFDGDDVSVFDRTVEFVTQTGIDLAQYATYIPFPGTLVYTSLEKSGRILHSDWSKYDGKHAVFAPQQMSDDELEEGLYRAWQNTYSSKSIFKRLTTSRTFVHFTMAANLRFKYFGKSFIHQPQQKRLASPSRGWEQP